MRKIFYLFAISIAVIYADMSPINIAPDLKNNRFMNIKILDQKQLSFSRIDSVKFSEISDLAYHRKTKRLYLLSDEGRLFAFKVDFRQKIEYAHPIFAVNLRKKNAKRFKKWRRDSEGMTLDGEGRLLISFEEKAKIAWFHKNSSKRGQMIYKYRLPRELRSIKAYRSKNKSLESLAWHPKYGILTASEWPLKKYNKKKQTVYSLGGKKWHFKAEPEAKSAISSIEVMDDGNLLVLERSFSGILSPFVITLKKVYIEKCILNICESKVLAKMNSTKGWAVDNFEGLAKVGKNRFVMISDDNDNFFQKTLMIYFEILDDDV